MQRVSTFSVLLIVRNWSLGNDYFNMDCIREKIIAYDKNVTILQDGKTKFESFLDTDPSSTNTTTDTNNDKEDYCRPRPLSEAYSVPPAARPITSLILPGQLPVTPSPTTSNPIEANYSIVPAPTPVIVSPSTPTAATSIPNGLELPLQGYMKMHPAGRWSSVGKIFKHGNVLNFRDRTLKRNVVRTRLKNRVLRVQTSIILNSLNSMFENTNL